MVFTNLEIPSAIKLGTNIDPTKNLAIFTNDDGTFTIARGIPENPGQTILSIDGANNLLDKSLKLIGGSAIVFSGTYSNVPVIDIPNVITPAYDLYEIEIYDVIARTTNSELWLRGSSDNGINWLAGNYSSRTGSNAGSVFSINSPGIPQMPIAGGVSANGGGLYTIKLLPAANPNLGPRANWTGGYWYSPGLVDIHVFGGGIFNSAASINAIRFAMSAGNIDAKVIIRGIGK